MHKFITAILFILFSQAAGIIGSVFTSKAIPTWYAGLTKPGFNPPSWLFGPVWILLYALMGIASFLVFEKRAQFPLAKPALAVFFIHLGLNALWSILFFGLKNPGLAFFEIIVLWAAILVLIFLFYRIDRPAAYLLIPYLAWVSFALVLNFSIWRLN